jgi:DNA-binding CsgD family transcriptional regulator
MRQLGAAAVADALRDALAVVVAAGDVPDGVREEIAASWQRSSGTGLRPDRFEVPHDPAFDEDALLVGAARPVLDQLSDDLVPTRMSVLLTDDRAHVLDRRVPDPSLQGRLDGISLAPGFMYAETLIGTNAIGTALAQRAPSVVDGHEHFADALTAMACAAAPITDPRNGRLLGAVDLTCWADDAGPLMLPLARRAAREIEQRLIDDARLGERVLLQRFLRERRRAKGPLVFVNERTMITNAAADRLVQPADEALLWECAGRLLAGGLVDPATVVLSDGSPVLARCEPVLDGAILLGALLRLTPVAQDGVSPPRAGGSRPFGWESVTATERSVIDLVAQGLTNREASQRLFVSPHTVDFHLRAIFRKLDVRTRVELTRVALEHGGGSVGAH